MNYSESKEILEQIKKANKILINCHRGPDPDSFGSALSLYTFINNQLKKDVDVVCTSNSQLSEDLNFLPNFNVVKSVDYTKFKFSEYDLFISSDSASWQQIVDDNSVPLPDTSIVIIDHHATNDKFGSINLVDAKKSSCAEMIYLILQDWGADIDADIATLLLAGMITDTGNFQFTNDANVLIHAGELVELGARKAEITDKIFRAKKFDDVRFWGEFLVNLKKDDKLKFFYTAIPFETYEKYGKPSKIASEVATMFGSIIKDLNFGMIMSEKDKGELDISFRSKGQFDVSKIAVELGGGGHKAAAGGTVKGLPFAEAVEKVLKVARKYAAQ